MATFDYLTKIETANKQYQATVAGYQQALSGMQAQQQAISEGYNQLQAGVLGTLSQASNEGLAALEGRYESAMGALKQQMTTRGLSNTTIYGQVGRGYLTDFNNADMERRAKFAREAAGRQQDIGLAGLGYRGGAIRDQTALQNAQLGYMGQYGAQQDQLALGYASLQQQEQQARNRQLYGGGGTTSGAMGGYYNPSANRQYQQELLGAQQAAMLEASYRNTGAEWPDDFAPVRAPTPQVLQWQDYGYGLGAAGSSELYDNNYFAPADAGSGAGGAASLYGDQWDY